MDRLNYPALAALLFAACGGTTGPPPPRADAGPRPDAVPVADAGPQNVCTDIEAVYGDLGELTGVALIGPADEEDPEGPQKLEIRLPLNEDAEPDILFVEFWETEEPFLSQGFVPLTQALTGDQADLITCGACAFIAANYVEENDIDFNMAFAGDLVIETIDVTPDTGSVTGTLTDVKFRAVTVDGAGQETIEDGCRSELEAVRFNFTVEAAVIEEPPV